MNPATLPRRANQISRLANLIAQNRLQTLAARQSVSDRIGYGIASLIGAGAYRIGGQTALLALVGIYGVSAVVAYRRYRRAMGKVA